MTGKAELWEAVAIGVQPIDYIYNLMSLWDKKGLGKFWDNVFLGAWHTKYHGAPPGTVACNKIKLVKKLRGRNE